MNNLFKAFVLLGACISAAQCLSCHHCSMAMFSKCLFKREVTCQNSTERCFRGESRFNATGVLKLDTRGCIDSDLCGKTITGTLLGAEYTSSFQCCTTELCNAASSLQLPLTAALLAAILTSVWSM